MRQTSAFINVYGGLTFGSLIAGNLSQLFWIIWLTGEQLVTGWGFGTNIEIFVLMIWCTQIIALPILVVGLIFVILNIKRKAAKWLSISNIILFGMLIMQYALINLFIYM